MSRYYTVARPEHHCGNLAKCHQMATTTVIDGQHGPIGDYCPTHAAENAIRLNAEEDLRSGAADRFNEVKT